MAIFKALNKNYYILTEPNKWLREFSLTEFPKIEDTKSKRANTRVILSDTRMHFSFVLCMRLNV